MDHPLPIAMKDFLNSAGTVNSDIRRMNNVVQLLLLLLFLSSPLFMVNISFNVKILARKDRTSQSRAPVYRSKEFLCLKTYFRRAMKDDSTHSLVRKKENRHQSMISECFGPYTCTTTCVVERSSSVKNCQLT